MASATAVLDLLLTARYVGAPAFAAMKADLADLTTSTSSLTKVGAAFSMLGQTMTAAGIGIGISMAMAIKQAADYADAVNRVVTVSGLSSTAIMTGKNAIDQQTASLVNGKTQLQAYNAEVANAAVKWGLMPTSIAQGTYYLTSVLGSLGKTPSDFLKSGFIGDLAAYVRASGPVGQGGVSYSEAAQTLPRMFGAFNVPMQQWGGAAGVLTYLENNAHLTQAQLVAGLTNFNPVASALGFDFPHSAALIAGEASAGIVGSKAGTELTSALTLMMAGKSNQKALAGLGFNTNDFYKNGQIIPPDQILGMIYGQLGKMSPSQRLVAEHGIFGMVGTRALAPLFGAGYEKYQNILGGMQRAGIENNPMKARLYMDAIAGGMMNSPVAKLQSLAAALSLLGITIGQKVMPYVMRFVDWLTKFALKLNDIISGNAKGGIAGLLSGVLGGKHGGAVLAGLAPALLGGGLGFSLMSKGLLHYGKIDSLLMSKTGHSILDIGLGKLLGAGGTFGAFTEPGRRMAKGLTPFGWMNAEKFPTLAYMHASTAGEHPLVAAGAHAFGAVKDIGSLGKSGILGGLGKLGDLAKFLNPITLITKGFSLLNGAIAGLIPLLVSIGGAALPIIGIFLLIAGAVAIIVIAFLKFRPQLAQIGAMIMSVVKPAFMMLMGVVHQVMTSIMQAWQKNSPAIMAAMKQLMAALLAAKPVFQVVMGVIVLVLTIVINIIGAVIRAFISALPGIIGFFTGIVHIITTVSQIIMAIFHGQWGAIPGLIMQLFGQIIGTIFGAVGTILGFIKNLVGNILGFFGNLFDKLVGHSIIPDMINGILKWFAQLPARLFGLIKNFVGTILGDIGHFKDMALNYFHVWALFVIVEFERLRQQAVQKVQGLISGALGFLQSLPGKFGTIASNAVNALVNGFKNGAGAVANAVGGLLSHIPGASFVMSHIPHLATGGTMRYGGLALVGEKGPELVRLAGGDHVFNSLQTETMFRAMGGANGPLRISHLHVDNLHLPAGQQQGGPAQARPIAASMMFARQVQAQREQLLDEYPHRSPFDDNYRYGYQWTR